MVLVYVERECFKANLAPYIYEPRSTAAEHIYDDIIPHVTSMNYRMFNPMNHPICAVCGQHPGGTSSSRRALVSYL